MNTTASNARLHKMVGCALFAALTAVCSQLAIPMPWGVPINLALFAVYMAGTMLGPVWGAASQLVYLLLAAVGVPVMAGMQGGPAVLLGKTGGYAIGYLLAALIAGAFAAKLPRKFGWLALGCVVGCAACYVLGTIWFMVLTGLDLPTSLTYCVIPYLPGDVTRTYRSDLLGGLVMVTTFDVTEIFAARNRSLQRFFLLEAAVVAGAAVVVWLVSRRLTHPLTVLTAASARIAAGDYALRTRMHTGDELEILSQGFDQMAGAVQDKVEALELSVQQRDDFVGAFTHELKTPMTGIIGYADLLRSIQPDPEEQREAAGAIFHEAQRLEALSGKLLQLMGLGEHAPQLVPVQLDSVFAEARRAVAPALNGCILTMQSNGLTVQGDADLLCDLVINLVTNAAKASTPGSAIAVCAEQADGSIRLTVQDHGQGIPADKLARVVEPFYMVDKSRSRRQGGSGLGLALCSRIAQAHGGTLAMESELGKGTTVTVTLPAPNQTAAELAQEEPV